MGPDGEVLGLTATLRGVVEDPGRVGLAEDDPRLFFSEVPLNPAVWLADDSARNGVDLAAEKPGISHRGKRGLSWENLTAVRQILTYDPELDAAIEVTITSGLSTSLVIP